MKQKNRITAALLALVFGGIGVHRFYLGKIVSLTLLDVYPGNYRVNRVYYPDMYV